MKNNILIHVPHSSLYIPDEYRKTALISQTELDEENLFMCRSLGLTTAINYPYAGSLVPNAYYGKKNTGIVSLMLEINKRILG